MTKLKGNRLGIAVDVDRISGFGQESGAVGGDDSRSAGY
jgi:hypothetical protein